MNQVRDYQDNCNKTLSRNGSLYPKGERLSRNTVKEYCQGAIAEHYQGAIAEHCQGAIAEHCQGAIAEGWNTGAGY